jgi:cobalt-zinc-cadmium efflux system protein
MRAARRHMLADALGSVGAVGAGVLVVVFDLRSADVVVGALVAVLIAAGAWSLVREAVNVLLEATPRDISLPEVRDAIAAQAGVLSVHDLHVWTLTSGYVALSAHVVVPDAPSTQRLLVPLRELLFHRFGISHATLQMETPQLDDEPVHCTDDPRCLP